MEKEFPMSYKEADRLGAVEEVFSKWQKSVEGRFVGDEEHVAETHQHVREQWEKGNVSLIIKMEETSCQSS